MTPDPNDVIRFASGSLVEVELWQGVLKEAGIESRVVGNELTTGLGTAFPDSIELWVHSGDVERATAALRDAEAHRGEQWAGRAFLSATDQ